MALAFPQGEPAEMPAASKSNIHGYIHGKGLTMNVNTSSVEEIQIKRHSSL